jgi:hypothetical protein
VIDGQTQRLGIVADVPTRLSAFTAPYRGVMSCRQTLTLVTTDTREPLSDLCDAARTCTVRSG